jgi:putative hydrolase of the HAD superfamily
MNNINTIIFDFGDVLVQDRTKVLEQKYNFDGMTPAKQKAYISAFHKAEVGKVSTSELLRVMHQTLVPDMSPKQIADYILGGKLLPAWKLALKLKKAGYKIIIFSNNQRTWPKKFSERLNTDFMQLPFINSATIGLRKPHLDLYRYMLKRYKINPTQALFIDDRSKNLPPAKQLGIKTFHYKQNFNDLKQFLKKHNVQF